VILDLKKFLISFLTVLGGLFLMHVLLLRAIPNFMGVSYSWVTELYLFLAILTTAHFMGLRLLFKKWPKHSGFLFTGMSLLKMAVAVLYLLPYIFPAQDSSAAKALNFMASYLIILTFEVIYLTRNMLKNQLF
jgi:hypothetical protein